MLNIGRLMLFSKRMHCDLSDLFHSWYQPAIDALTLALMREFNSLDQRSRTGGYVQPLIYGTFQAYLRRYLVRKSLPYTITEI